jgi:hypothetical protein
MKSKLAGYQPLRELVQATINENARKLAIVNDESEKTASVQEPEKVETPTGLDFHDLDHMDKLAAALEEAGEKLAAGDMGGESRVGGELLDNNKGTPGTQQYKKNKALTEHTVKADEGKTSKHPDGAGGPGTLVGDNMGMGVKPAYPAKGVLKKASASILEQLRSKTAGENPFAKKDGDKKEEKKEGDGDKVKKLVAYEKKEHGHIPSEKEEKEEKKEASAVDFILGAIDKAASVKKTAAGEQGNAAIEKKMGGETLDSPSESGPKPPSNPGQKAVMSISAAINAKKRELKAPRKAELAQVLTEPAFSAAHDSKVQENLRNASKGGVKIAVAKTLLHKIAEEGCKCDGKGECQYCKLKAKVEAKKSEKKD